MIYFVCTSTKDYDIHLMNLWGGKFAGNCWVVDNMLS